MHMELMAPICNNLDLPPCRAFMWSSHPRHHISKVLSLLLPASLMYTICGFVFATSLLSHSEKVAHSIANQLENIRLKYKERGNPAGWLFRLFSRYLNIVCILSGYFRQQFTLKKFFRSRDFSYSLYPQIIELMCPCLSHIKKTKLSFICQLASDLATAEFRYFHLFDVSASLMLL